MPSFAITLLTSLLFIDILSATALEKKSIDDDRNNCPGVWFTIISTTGCCVGGTLSAPFLSVCDGWPICQGPVTTTDTPKPLSCATVVTEAPDYPQVMSKVREILSESGTNIRTTLDVFGYTSSTPATSTPSAQASARFSNSSPTATLTNSVGAVTTTTSSGGAPEWTARIGFAGGAMLAAAML